MFKNPTAGDQEACEGASARRNKNKMSKKHTPHTPRRAVADEFAHEQAEIESTHVNEQAFEDVLSVPQKQPTHTASFEQMSVRAFDATQRASAATLARGCRECVGDWHTPPSVHLLCLSISDDPDPVRRCNCEYH